MEKKYKLGEKEVIVSEISYFDALEIEEVRQTSIKNAARKLLEKSTNLTQEELDRLNLKDGLEIQKLVNEVNKFGDFQASGQPGAVN
jgi:hypothetical protein